MGSFGPRLTLLTILLAISGRAVPQSRADDTAIRELVSHYVDARERIDPAATAALFTEDADQLVSSGEWRKGRDQVVEGSMKSSKASTGKRTIEVVTIRFLNSEVAIVDGHYDLAGSTASEARHMWTTLIVKRTASDWKIAAIRNMLPAAPAK
jgi:uncharacterized protein (TIGR02246 family)